MSYYKETPPIEQRLDFKIQIDEIIIVEIQLTNKNIFVLSYRTRSMSRYQIE